MTAKSELFVEEIIRDKVADRLGVKVDIECPPDWKDIWNDAEFPEEGIANILRMGEIIGTISWTTTFEIEDDGSGKFIEASVKDLVIVVKNLAPRKQKGRSQFFK